MSGLEAEWKDADISAALAATSFSDRRSFLEEIELQWNLSSLHLAERFRPFACIVHEGCDWTCQGFHLKDLPLISPETPTLTALRSTVSLESRHVVTSAMYHDIAWMEMRGFPQYQYNGIDSYAGQIRLLKVKEAFFHSDVVECEVITAFLGQDIEFQALSYCWGSKGLVEDMLCDGARHSVTSSLNMALKAYRQSPLQGTPLWVDAVSIDQVNKVEMVQQIPLMRQIYREAAGVFVHLGEAGKVPWFQALDLISLLSILQKASKNAEHEVKAIMYDILPNSEHPSWDYFARIFSSPWFRRTWIIQELALAKRAKVCNGRFGYIDWEIMEAAWKFIYSSGLSNHFPLRKPNPETEKGWLNFAWIQHIRMIAQSPNDTALMRVLNITHRFEVSDPRDKILGVLGLVGDLPAELRVLIDYALSTSQVYHLAAIYLIEIGTAGQVLDHAGLQRQSAAVSIPSWVPDWTADIKENNGRPLSLLKLMPFTAGGTQGGRTSIVGSEGELYPREIAIRGFCHHTITKASEMSNPSGELLESWERVRAAKACFEEFEGFAYSNVDEAFARTLLVDDLNNDALAVKTFAPITDLVPTFQIVTENLEKLSRQYHSKNVSFEVLQERSADEVRTLYTQMTAAIWGRRFVITDSGHMALVPDRAEVGDKVAFFLEYAVPYVLRPNAISGITECGHGIIHGKLVGDCYIHGMMNGEAIDEATSRNRDWSMIVLD